MSLKGTIVSLYSLMALSAHSQVDTVRLRIKADAMVAPLLHALNMDRSCLKYTYLFADKKNYAAAVRSNKFTFSCRLHYPFPYEATNNGIMYYFFYISLDSNGNLIKDNIVSLPDSLKARPIIPINKMYQMRWSVNYSDLDITYNSKSLTEFSYDTTLHKFYFMFSYITTSKFLFTTHYSKYTLKIDASTGEVIDKSEVKYKSTDGIGGVF